MFQKLCAGMPGRKTKSRKGFTLAELLIVVAIVAILVAIAIPVFSSQLTKAKAGTDLANLRSAYAAAKIEQLTNSSADKSAYENAIKDALPDVQSQLDSSKGFVVTVSGDEITVTLGGKTQAELQAMTK